jgi:hypothetical protein
MKPETKKGMFANGKSSVPGVINLIESTKAGSKLVSPRKRIQLNGRSKSIFIPINAGKTYDGITRNKRGLGGSMETEIFPTPTTSTVSGPTGQ